MVEVCMQGVWRLFAVVIPAAIKAVLPRCGDTAEEEAALHKEGTVIVLMTWPWTVLLEEKPRVSAIFVQRTCNTATLLLPPASVLGGRRSFSLSLKRRARSHLPATELAGKGDGRHS